MKKYGLIGFPLSHSFSKKYFSEKFINENIQGVEYNSYPLEDITALPSLLSSEPMLAGLNVTIPYKEKVIPFLDELSDEVKEIGACNCISIKGTTLKGYNTDVIGFEKSLMKKLKPYHQKALVLGTGGAAKAVYYILRKNQIPFLKVSRTAGENQLTYESLTKEIIESHQLIVNTTPLGMYPEVNSFPPIPYQYVGDQHYLFDLVYNPAKTIFLSRGEERGAAIENGADMLVDQAEASWDIWMG
jgi:shikimate dehydrogenase